MWLLTIQVLARNVVRNWLLIEGVVSNPALFIPVPCILISPVVSLVNALNVEWIWLHKNPKTTQRKVNYKGNDGNSTTLPLLNSLKLKGVLKLKNITSGDWHIDTKMLTVS